MSPPGSFQNRDVKHGFRPCLQALPSYHSLLLGNFSSFSTASILGLSLVHLSQTRTGFCWISELVTAPSPNAPPREGVPFAFLGPGLLVRPVRFLATRPPGDTAAMVLDRQPRSLWGKQGSATVSDGPPSFGWRQLATESRAHPLLFPASERRWTWSSGVCARPGHCSAARYSCRAEGSGAWPLLGNVCRDWEDVPSESPAGGAPRTHAGRAQEPIWEQAGEPGPAR